MECSHTPGPWEINEGEGIAIAKVSLFAITAPCTPNVGSGLSREENAANARLIAEAPELLAALKAVSETGDDCPMCDRGRLRNPQKTHWPECPFGRAQRLIAKIERACVEHQRGGPRARRDDMVMLYAVLRHARVAGNVDYLATVIAVNEEAAEAWARGQFDLGEGERFIIEEEDDEAILSTFGSNTRAQSPDKDR